MKKIENETAMVTKTSYYELSTDRKIYLLSILAHEITVRARGAYPGQEQEQEVAKKYVAFNELQHKISGQLRNMLAQDEKRYPDEVFIDILFEVARSGDCERDLQIAFKFAFDHLNNDES